MPLGLVSLIEFGDAVEDSSPVNATNVVYAIGVQTQSFMIIRCPGTWLITARLLLLLLLLLHQRANQGFELLDTIANTDNRILLQKTWRVGAGESNVLAYAGLARKLAIASDSVDRQQSVSCSIKKRYFWLTYLRLLQKLHDNCCFSRRRSRR